MRVSIVLLAMVAAPMLATTSYAQGNSRNNPGCAHWKQDAKFASKDAKKGQCGKNKKDDGGVVVVPTATGSQVTGAVFNDANFTGVRDPEEGGVTGWTVTLMGASSTASATTDAAGAYKFANVAVGDYDVCVTPVGPGQYQTMPGGGTACPSGWGWTVSVTVTGSVVSGVDFGFGYWMP
jgi:hypothetical protein